MEEPSATPENRTSGGPPAPTADELRAFLIILAGPVSVLLAVVGMLQGASGLWEVPEIALAIAAFGVILVPTVTAVLVQLCPPREDDSQENPQAATRSGDPGPTTVAGTGVPPGLLAADSVARYAVFPVGLLIGLAGVLWATPWAMALGPACIVLAREIASKFPSEAIPPGSDGLPVRSTQRSRPPGWVLTTGTALAALVVFISLTASSTAALSGVGWPPFTAAIERWQQQTVDRGDDENAASTEPLGEAGVPTEESRADDSAPPGANGSGDGRASGPTSTTTTSTSTTTTTAPPQPRGTCTNLDERRYDSFEELASQILDGGEAVADPIGPDHSTQIQEWRLADGPAAWLMLGPNGEGYMLPEPVIDYLVLNLVWPVWDDESVELVVDALGGWLVGMCRPASQSDPELYVVVDEDWEPAAILFRPNDEDVEFPEEGDSRVPRSGNPLNRADREVLDDLLDLAEVLGCFPSIVGGPPDEPALAGDATLRNADDDDATMDDIKRLAYDYQVGPPFDYACPQPGTT